MFVILVLTVDFLVVRRKRLPNILVCILVYSSPKPSMVIWRILRLCTKIKIKNYCNYFKLNDYDSRSYD